MDGEGLTHSCCVAVLALVWAELEVVEARLTEDQTAGCTDVNDRLSAVRLELALLDEACVRLAVSHRLSIEQVIAMRTAVEETLGALAVAIDAGRAPIRRAVWAAQDRLLEAVLELAHVCPERRLHETSRVRVRRPA